MKHDRFMELTRIIAAGSECTPQHAAIIVKGNRVLAVSTNVQKTHPIFLKYHHAYVKTIHAEARVLTRGDFENCILYSARNIKGSFGLSKPCQTCMSLLVAAKIRTLVFWEDGFIIERL